MSGTSIAQPKNTSAVFRNGVVLDIAHPTDPTAYFVHFGEKTASVSGRLDSGVWCHNGISSFVRYRNAENQPVAYGSYSPIQPYTPVNVLMSNGGIGMPTIIGFTPTNTSAPDMTNKQNLHVVYQTPGGSAIEMDDNVGAIRLMYNQGSSIVSLAEDIINLEVNDGDPNGRGKVVNTSLSMRKGGFKFQLKDSMMQFDETGFSVSFNDGGTSVKFTKKGVIMEGMDVFKVASDEQISIKGSKMTLEGTKDASLSASELKIGGKQLTNITGSQINIESMFAISLKSLAINLFAKTKIQEFAILKDTTCTGSIVRTAPIITEQAAQHAFLSGTFVVGAAMIGLDANIYSNMGIGLGIATPTYAAAKAATVASHAALTALGTAMILKALPITVVNKVLADTLAGTSEPAQEPSGNASGARDKNDKKSYGSVAATKFMTNKAIMEKFSTVPSLMATSASALTTSSSYANQGTTGALGTVNRNAGAYINPASVASAARSVETTNTINNIKKRSGSASSRLFKK